jgi:hypothetical protein
MAICFGVLVSEVLGLNVLLGMENLWPIAIGEFRESINLIG